MPNSAAAESRDRFVGLAFAAADLLTEIGADRRVTFAAGAFRERFGYDSDAATGAPFSSLIAAEDQAGLEIALSLVAARGRLTPTMLRLNNAARTQMALSGLRLPNHDGVTWLTLSRMPASAPQAAALAAAAVFREALQARSMAASPGNVGLVEVGGWQHLQPDRRRALEEDIARALRSAAGADALAADMEDGRFGVLGGAALNLAELQTQVGAALRAAGAARPVAGITIPFGDGEAAAPAQTVRAMRFALSCFTAGGTQAVKQAGFADGLSGFLRSASTRAAAARSAIENGRFKLAFQPVVKLADRTVHHYEALLRPYPIAGHESTGTQEFVRFAEAVGLAELLDTAVLRRAAGSLGSGQARVAINISGLSVQSPQFRETLLAWLEEHPALRGRLMVELTETAEIDDVPSAVETVSRLAAAGVPVCLDDFGAGFAAFRYLRAFKVDFVKIDGSFVRQALDGAREGGFISAMVELARCVGAHAIAEMVETEQEARAMRELGVQYGQGWLFGRPGGLPGSL